MNKVQAYYDRTAGRYSLSWAIVLTVSSSFLCSTGIFELLKFLRAHDSFYLLIGLFTSLPGAAGIFQGVQVTQAVVRRRIAEARLPD